MPVNGIVVADNSTQLPRAFITVTYGSHVRAGKLGIGGSDDGGSESSCSIASTNNSGQASCLFYRVADTGYESAFSLYIVGCTECMTQSSCHCIETA